VDDVRCGLPSLGPRSLRHQAAIHYNLAQALAGLGRLAEAAGHYRTALAIQPGFADARASLERLLQGMGAAGPGA
jgi:hypothetical protein